jgi:hypothetical protein
MGKFNLSEAAKEILGQTTSKMGSGDKFGQGKKLAADEQGNSGDIGTEVTQTTDSGPQATKGAPTAKAPGATPPVGSEPMQRLKSQPAQQGSVERPEGKPGRQMMAKNPGAQFMAQEEEEFDDEDLLDEAKCDDEEGHEDEAQDKKMMKKEKMKEKMKEDIDALLQGENLSEEFVSRASTIFEAAVIARAEEVILEAERELTEQFELAVEEIKNDLAEKVDGYLGYMVEEWMKENELAIERGLRAEIVEDFIGGLRDLFTEHYIDIPSEKVDVAEELAARVEELEDALNEQINRNVEMNKDLNEQRKLEAIYTACEGLTQTQVEKLKALAEGVEYSDEFADKLDVLKESYFKVESKAPSYNSFDDEVVIEEEKKTTSFISEDPMIAQYAKTISQTLIK